jgi:hypothetical protein
MTIANVLAYYSAATIMAKKSFIVQAPGGQNLNVHLNVVYVLTNAENKTSVAFCDSYCLASMSNI